MDNAAGNDWAPTPEGCQGWVPVTASSDGQQRVDGGAEDSQAVGPGARTGLRVGTETGLHGVLGVGHESDDVAAFIAYAGDVAGRAVGVAHVAEDDEALPLEAVELLGRGDEVASPFFMGRRSPPRP